RQWRGGIASQPPLLEEVHQLLLADPEFACEFVCLHARTMIMPFSPNPQTGGHLPSTPRGEGQGEGRELGEPLRADQTSGPICVFRDRSRAFLLWAVSIHTASLWR